MRMPWVRARATVFSTSSPARCPWRSLTRLKWSTSATSNERGRPCRWATATSAAKRSWKWRRLYSPVSGSRSAASTSLRCTAASISSATLNLKVVEAPIWKRSSLESSFSATRSPSMKVPLALPRSRSRAPRPRGWTLQCRRETPSSRTRRSASPRPMTVTRSGVRRCSSPTCGPERTSRNGLFSRVERCGAGATVVFSNLSIVRGIRYGSETFCLRGRGMLKVDSRFTSVRREMPREMAASVWLPAQRESASTMRWRSACASCSRNSAGPGPPCKRGGGGVGMAKSEDGAGDACSGFRMAKCEDIFSAGRCESARRFPAQSSTARSITLRSSRMLPGQR